MNCWSAPFRAVCGVKNDYTHCGSTIYGFGVMVKMKFVGSESVMDSERKSYLQSLIELQFIYHHGIFHIISCSQWIRIHFTFKDPLHPILPTFDSSVSPTVCLPDIRSLYSFFTAQTALSVPRGHSQKIEFLNILSVKLIELLVCTF